MKKLSPLRVMGFIGAFIVSIFLLAIIFLNQIKSEIFQLISSYGYPAVFILTLIIEFLAQPIGPEIPLLSGKIMELNMMHTALITIIGSIMASLINYRIGKLFYKKFCKGKRYDRYLAWYKKHGKYGLLIAALGPVPYVPFCWFSGAFGLSIRNFLYLGIFPRILRIMFISYMISLFL